jgi:hypothetical protein
MSVTLNAKGTSVPSFTIGKGGVTIHQGLTDPSLSYDMKDGDYWLDKTTNSMKVWTTVGLTWQAPRLADLHFVDSSIVAPGGQDLTISVDTNHYVNIDSGISGPSLITTNNSQDLHINPAIGGGQYLVLCANRWPAADGTNGQSLKTNGTGTLGWYTPTAGTVTSVSGSGGTTGLTFTGSPITSSGTLTLAGTLSAFNGGTGATSSTDAFNNLVPSQVTNGGKFLTTDGTNTSWAFTPLVAPNYEEYIATSLQTVFNTTMTTITKASGKAYLQVFVDGIFQQEGPSKKFTVTGTNQITFTTGLTINSDVVIYGYV